MKQVTPIHDSMLRYNHHLPKHFKATIVDTFFFLFYSPQASQQPEDAIAVFR